MPHSLNPADKVMALVISLYVGASLRGLWQRGRLKTSRQGGKREVMAGRSERARGLSYPVRHTVDKKLTNF